ncbi:Serine/threonine-protein kinase pkn1 [Phycisphaerae bacterium RAS2]|nr:Serine/threonine-protein kinase pkn1 [Phycisphaerae bacterium RAS2]
MRIIHFVAALVSVAIAVILFLVFKSSANQGAASAIMRARTVANESIATRPVNGMNQSGHKAFSRPTGVADDSIPSKERDPTVLTLDCGGGQKIELILVSPGEFMMGSPPNDSLSSRSVEGPQRLVQVREGFYLGRFEVTQEQWQAVMGNNPSHFKGDDPPPVGSTEWEDYQDFYRNRPVESVSWDDCQSFCRRLTEVTGRVVRLPTEAEWEYACRAGTTDRYHFDETLESLEDYAWCMDNSAKQTHRVGTRKPNPWGFFDMYGNVWEWCEDYIHMNYKNAPGDSRAWLERVSREERVVRGGCFEAFLPNYRSANRFYFKPQLRISGLGLRIASSAKEAP